jgi:adenylate cyclase
MAAPSERKFAEAGLLDGVPEGPGREARLALLRDLAAEGIALEEMREALAEDRLPFMQLDRVLSGPPRHTPREVAERAGVPLDLVLDVRQAIGLARPDPDARVFDDSDLVTAQTFARILAAGIPAEGMLEVTRVLGSSLAQAAEAMRMVFTRTVVHEGLDEHELALRNLAAVRELLPLMGPLMEHTLRLQMRDLVRNQQFENVELEAGAAPGVSQVWVGFADMVGFTRLGELIDPSGLGGLVTRLNEITLAAARPPVRLVKTIGDAAMFVSPTPGPLVETALDVVARADGEGEEFPSLRAGLAGGAALNTAGDWYGRPVNLASRVTAVARAGSVLASKEVRDAVPDGYSWSAAGNFHLKGFKRRMALYRVRAPDLGARD